MKKLFFTAVLALCSFAGFSQNAEEVLKNVERTINSYQNVELKFSYIGSNNQAPHKGTLLLEGNKYNLQFMGVNQIYDGSKTYLINSDDKEVTISNHTKTQTFNLYDLIKSYKNSFRASIAKKNNSEIVIDLTPTTKSSIKKAELVINAKNYQIVKKVDYFFNGSSASLIVNNIKTNQKISQDMFSFNKQKFSDYYFNYID